MSREQDRADRDFARQQSIENRIHAGRHYAGAEQLEREQAGTYVDGEYVSEHSIAAWLDNLDRQCAAGIHPREGRTGNAHGEKCGACGRRIAL